MLLPSSAHCSCVNYAPHLPLSYAYLNAEWSEIVTYNLFVHPAAGLRRRISSVSDIAPELVHLLRNEGFKKRYRRASERPFRVRLLLDHLLLLFQFPKETPKFERMIPSYCSAVQTRTGRRQITSAARFFLLMDEKRRCADRKTYRIMSLADPYALDGG